VVFRTERGDQTVVIDQEGLFRQIIDFQVNRLRPINRAEIESLLAQMLRFPEFFRNFLPVQLQVALFSEGMRGYANTVLFPNFENQRHGVQNEKISKVNTERQSPLGRSQTSPSLVTIPNSHLLSEHEVYYPNYPQIQSSESKFNLDNYDPTADLSDNEEELTIECDNEIMDIEQVSGYTSDIAESLQNESFDESKSLAARPKSTPLTENQNFDYSFSLGVLPQRRFFNMNRNENVSNESENDSPYYPEPIYPDYDEQPTSSRQALARDRRNEAQLKEASRIAGLFSNIEIPRRQTRSNTRNLQQNQNRNPQNSNNQINLSTPQISCIERVRHEAKNLANLAAGNIVPHHQTRSVTRNPPLSTRRFNISIDTNEVPQNLVNDFLRQQKIKPKFIIKKRSSTSFKPLRAIVKENQKNRGASFRSKNEYPHKCVDYPNCISMG
jgi:hypothetical protein